VTQNYPSLETAATTPMRSVCRFGFVQVPLRPLISVVAHHRRHVCSHSAPVICGIIDRTPDLKRALILALQTAAICTATELPTAKPESVGFSTDRLQNLHSLIQNEIDQEQLAGAVTILACHGKIIDYRTLRPARHGKECTDDQGHYLPRPLLASP